MGDESYLEANRKAQFIVLLTFLSVVVIVVSLEPLLYRVVPSISASLEGIEASGRLLLLLALVSHVASFALSLFWIVHLVHAGYRTLKLGSYPPPGTMVVFRTRVRTGKEAAVSGYLSIAFAVLMIAPIALTAYVTWLIMGAL
jgi:hypothetical protein